MNLPRPSLFIGSSTEGLAVAHALQEPLHHDMDPTVWSQGLFQPTASLLQKLVREARQYDLAVFVFVPDDDLVFRQQQYRAVRDNVVFEYGLFVGTLGLERCVLLTPFDAPDVRLPTDLLGVVPLTFNASRSDRNLVAALGPAVKLFWPNAATLLAFPGPAAEFWNPPPQLANLYMRWETAPS